MFNFSRLLLLLLLWSAQSNANTTLNTQCTKNEKSGLIEGVNINTPYTIASVTKVFTSHWAVSRLGPKYRFPTVIHLTPLTDNIYDIHIEGALYPYFDKVMYQFLVGELNRIGVKFINKLTFDENFIYATDLRYAPTFAHGNDDIDRTKISADILKDTLNLNAGLSALNAKALALENLKLPASLSLKINTVEFVEKKDFTDFANTVVLYLPSSELYRNLKEMNRNSNNFVADKFFKKLSGGENYSDFILNRLINIKPYEITLYNGSGYPVMDNGDKVYGQASCAAVVEMMTDLRRLMLNSGMDLKDLLPVAGKDATDDGISTITQIYGNAQTAGALIGKTGSVSDTIALSGLVMTENENLYFQTSFNVNNTPEDRASAYYKIKEWLGNILLHDKQKTELVNYQPNAFLPFDKSSQLRQLDLSELRNYPKIF